MRVQSIDEDFIHLFGLEFLSGRNFRRDAESDQNQAYILNETAVRYLGWEEPLGKAISLSPSRSGKVIGVVKDFHFDSLHSKIDPLALHFHSTSFGSLGVMAKAQNLDETMEFLQNTWKDLMPVHTVPQFRFLDEYYDQQYRTERQIGAMATIFSALAIFLACLGLLGLVSYAVDQRTKEIGIRKVLGSSSGSIVLLLSKDFVKWVVFANVLAWPVAYFAADQWLQSFPYRIDVSLFPFVSAASLALVIAVGMVSVQVWKAAQVDPVISLKNE